jgi:AmiR/NasT family two-component response regulator
MENNTKEYLLAKELLSLRADGEQQGWSEASLLLLERAAEALVEVLEDRQEYHRRITTLRNDIVFLTIKNERLMGLA